MTSLRYASTIPTNGLLDGKLALPALPAGHAVSIELLLLRDEGRAQGARLRSCPAAGLIRTAMDGKRRLLARVDAVCEALHRAPDLDQATRAAVVELLAECKATAIALLRIFGAPRATDRTSPAGPGSTTSPRQWPEPRSNIASKPR